MKLRPYPAYHATGVSWLGAIPSGWRVERLKYAAPAFNEKVDARSVDLQYLGMENIESGTGRYVEGEETIESDGLASHYHAGDVLFGKLRPYLAKALLASSEGVCSSELLVLKARSVAPKYLFYYVLSDGFIKEVDSSTYGSKMPRANWNFVGNLPVPVANKSEQTSIFNFLDHETAKLDTLMAKQERLIELLQEKRQAVISRAVTNGLDPKAQLKDSGVEWLGEVPAHWNVRRIASISTKITNGYVGPTRDILVTDGVRYLQSLHIKGNRVRFDEPYFVTAEWSNEHRKSILDPGDVLIVQTGDIGQVAVVTEDFAGCNCHALIIVSPRRTVILGEWLSWVLNSTYGFHSLLAIQTGALHPHLNCGNVRDVNVPIPPLQEQRKIVEFIRTENERFDELIKKVSRSIDLMREHRSALISAAVTGKIDVREAA
ncbi:MAG: restriction endonuclease subunit S [Fimbriimonadaceae bacterium]|nr:restriction endonuclease subunit S [Fimbriimonadaceae bacterium]